MSATSLGPVCDQDSVLKFGFKLLVSVSDQIQRQLEMWANAQRDGRPAEHRWRPLFNAAKFG